jgi:hypothetical protein
MRLANAFLTILSVLTCGSLLHAQTAVVQIKPQPGAPIEITQAVCTEKPDGLNCAAEVRVLTDAGVTAYSLKWRYITAKGASISGSNMSIRGLRPADRPWQQGDTTKDTSVSYVKFKPGELSYVEVEIEFVVPAVGPAWGNTKSAAYYRMIGFRSGYKEAVEMLKGLYAKQGVEAVLNELGIRKD